LPILSREVKGQEVRRHHLTEEEPELETAPEKVQLQKMTDEKIIKIEGKISAVAAQERRIEEQMEEVKLIQRLEKLDRLHHPKRKVEKRIKIDPDQTVEPKNVGIDLNPKIRLMAEVEAEVAVKAKDDLIDLEVGQEVRKDRTDPEAGPKAREDRIVPEAAREVREGPEDREADQEEGRGASQRAEQRRNLRSHESLDLCLEIRTLNPMQGDPDPVRPHQIREVGRKRKGRGPRRL